MLDAHLVLVALLVRDLVEPLMHGHALVRVGERQHARSALRLVNVRREGALRHLLALELRLAPRSALGQRLVQPMQALVDRHRVGAALRGRQRAARAAHVLDLRAEGALGERLLLPLLHARVRARRPVAQGDRHALQELRAAALGGRGLHGGLERALRVDLRRQRLHVLAHVQLLRVAVEALRRVPRGPLLGGDAAARRRLLDLWGESARLLLALQLALPPPLHALLLLLRLAVQVAGGARLLIAGHVRRHERGLEGAALDVLHARRELLHALRLVEAALVHHARPRRALPPRRQGLFRRLRRHHAAIGGRGEHQGHRAWACACRGRRARHGRRVHRLHSHRFRLRRSRRPFRRRSGVAGSCRRHQASPRRTASSKRLALA
mmetsp:Transcript_30511/g.97343  ORF Transcript_30511/g.97343 Transcript_30511/m.97343 type:complete len:381 (-) Transcript_30511:229-1371(-)